MDTTKLVVGQEVYMSSGIWADRGIVVKITQEGAEVFSTFGGDLLRFFADGCGWDVDGTYECGAWELSDDSLTRSMFRKPAGTTTLTEFADALIQVNTEHPDWEVGARLKEARKYADMKAFGSERWTPEFTAAFNQVTAEHPEWTMGYRVKEAQQRAAA